MAESNFGGPLQRPYSMGSTPPALQPQDPDYLSRPSYQGFSSFRAYDPYSHYPGSFRPDHYSQADPHVPHNRYHPPAHPGPQTASWYPSSTSMFQHGSHGAATSGMPPIHQVHPHGLHMPPSPPHSDFIDARNHNSLPPMADSSMHNGGDFYPPYPQVASTPMPGFNPYLGGRPNSYATGGPPSVSGRFGGEAMQLGGEGQGLRSASFGNSEQPRHMTSPSRRTSYERQHQHTGQGSGGPERRPLSFLNAQARRSDRSVSPRTSNRRSFDRYSTDLSNNSTSSETEEAARARMHRARRQRTLALGSEYRHRPYASVDPNVPTASQMQALKDKLRHLLPSELPSGSSTMCDICQKDYASKHVLPSEDEEVAIQLPCKHIFGEHCINTWFSTCKEHKNKVTCPMCRELLIQPQRLSAGLFASGAPPQILAFLSRVQGDERRHLLEMLQPEERLAFNALAERELEGDFDHT